MMASCSPRVAALAVPASSSGQRLRTVAASGAHRCHSAAHFPQLHKRRGLTVAKAGEGDTKVTDEAKATESKGKSGMAKLAESAGVALGPIALTLGEDIAGQPEAGNGAGAGKGGKGGEWEGKSGAVNNLMDGAGVSLGPIGLTIGDGVRSASEDQTKEEEVKTEAQSIADVTSEEWQAQHLKEDGTVDLWLQDSFNAASREVASGVGSGEGESLGGVETHNVTIVSGVTGEKFVVDVPEDRYILFEAESQGYDLPFACRQGCCTKCAVKITKGELYQPQAIGISKELKQQGYALMCVGFPLSDLEIVTQDEDEVYDKQFGQFFDQQALDPSDPNYIERDDFALEIADMDE